MYGMLLGKLRRRFRPWRRRRSTGSPSAPIAVTCLAGGALASSPCCTRVDPAVVGGDVLRARVGEQLVAALHLVDRPLQRVRRLLHVGDDRQEHVRDAVEGRELDDLGIDHQQAQLVGRAPEEQARRASR